jgi:hypothetical protein
MTTPNWRREPRIDAKLPVVVVRGKTTTDLETSDVSFKGLFVRTQSPPPVRSLVRLRVALPSREIEAHAMAVHVGDAGVGLQFWGLAGPDRTAWDDYVRDLAETRRASAKTATPPPVSVKPTAPPPSSSKKRNKG